MFSKDEKEFRIETTDFSHFVFEPKFMCPAHSEAKQTKTSEFRAEKGLLQGPYKENRWFMLKRPELPDGFQGSIFKDKVREGSRRFFDQLVHSSLIG